MLQTKHCDFSRVVFVSCPASCMLYPGTTHQNQTDNFPKWECIWPGQSPVVCCVRERVTPDNVWTWFYSDYRLIIVIPRGCWLDSGQGQSAELWWSSDNATDYLQSWSLAVAGNVGCVQTPAAPQTAVTEAQEWFIDPTTEIHDIVHWLHRCR